MYLLTYIQVFTVSVCLNNVRQNRKERLLQKKWSHIEPHLIAPLDEKEVSLKVSDLINHLFLACSMRNSFITFFLHYCH